MYVKEVMNQELYEINPKKQCFAKLDLKAEELCKVVSLHYVVGPPTLVSLKLGEENIPDVVYWKNLMNTILCHARFWTLKPHIITRLHFVTLCQTVLHIVNMC